MTRSRRRATLTLSSPEKLNSQRDNRKRKYTSRLEQDTLYEVRSIISQKIVAGRVRYLINWEDDRATGEQYPNSWEPAENVTEQVIQEWEARHRTDSDPSPSSKASTPRATSPNISTLADEDDLQHRAKRQHICAINFLVEINDLPNIDTTEFTYFSASQLSVFDTQEGPPPESEAFGGAKPYTRNHTSQSTIPDSQETSSQDDIVIDDPEADTHSTRPLDLPDDPILLDENSIIDESGAANAAQPRTFDLDWQASAVTGATIQSSLSSTRRPCARVESSSVLDSLTTRSSHATDQLTNVPPSQVHSQESAKSAAELSLPSPPFEPVLEFLTQPEFDNDASSSLQATEDRDCTASGHPDRLTQSEFSGKRQPSSSVVESPRYSTQGRPQFLTQVSYVISTGSLSDSPSCIPDSIQKQPIASQGRVSRSLLPSIEHDDEIISEGDATAPSRPNSRPSTPDNAIMDTTSTAGLSTLERLKRAQAAVSRSPQASISRSPSVAVADITIEPAAKSASTLSLPGGTILIEPLASHVTNLKATESNARIDPLLPSQSPALSHTSFVTPAEAITLDTIGEAIGLVASTATEVSSGIDPSTLLITSTISQETDNPVVAPLSSIEQVAKTLASQDMIVPDEPGQNEFVVTLPPLSSLRADYCNLLLKHEAMLDEYNAFFKDLEDVPSAELSGKVDDLIEQVSDLCNLPTFVADLDSLSPEELKRHARETNSKFMFVYELLERIRDVNYQVLILAKPGPIMKVFDAILSTENFRYRYFDDDESTQVSSQDSLRIVLASTSRKDMSSLWKGFDIVVAFDQTANPSMLAATSGVEGDGPMIVSPVIAYTLEHIDRRISRKTPVDQRRNAVLVSTCTATTFVLEPAEDLPPPHEKAEALSMFIRDAEQAQEYPWCVADVPDAVFSIYIDSHSQPASSLSAAGVHAHAAKGRKRQLVDDTEQVDSPKRARVDDSEEVDVGFEVMSDALKGLLQYQGKLSGGGRVSAPLTVLEAMVHQMSDLQEELRLSTQRVESLGIDLNATAKTLRGYEKSLRAVQPKYMEALQDRGKFEAEHSTAVGKVDGLQAQIDARNTKIAKLEEENKDLTSDLIVANDRLQSSSVPEAATLAKAEAAARDLDAKCKHVEARLASTTKDMDYTREQYQSASNQAVSLAGENTTLQEQITILTRKASHNIVKVHQINSTSQVAELKRMYDEQVTIVAERERELERVREDLRTMKAGRRGAGGGGGGGDARQVSVPRSPRAVLSPRAGGAAGAKSRATSPGLSPFGARAGGVSSTAAVFVGSGGGGSSSIAGERGSLLRE